MLKYKNAVITGCNRGIGKAILSLFASNGANIWACVRSLDDQFLNYIEVLSKEKGVKITPIICDLKNEDEIKSSFNQIVKSELPVDILVNNAGIIHTALFQMTSMKKMREIFEINYFSQMQVTQLIVKKMVRNKSGSIINLSSSAAIEGNEGRSAYSASKAAIIAATTVLSRELAAYNIRVNGIAPGLTMTDMMKESTPEKDLNKTLDRISLSRVGDPEEIANVALFLGSNLSSYITGQVLRVDGGM